MTDTTRLYSEEYWEQLALKLAIIEPDVFHQRRAWTVSTFLNGEDIFDAYLRRFLMRYHGKCDADVVIQLSFAVDRVNAKVRLERKQEAECQLHFIPSTE